jgi:hypothetical protein
MNTLNKEPNDHSNDESALPISNKKLSIFKKIPSWVKTFLAILVSLGILGFYFKDINWQKFIEATKEANLWMAFLSILIPQMIFWLFSVYQMERTFVWFHRGFPWRDYVWVRGALYLLMMINTGVGGAGNVLYLQQKTQISWIKFIAISFFRFSVQMAAIGMLLIVSTIAMHMIGVFKDTPLNPWIWWTVLILGQLTFWDAWSYFVVGKPIGLSRFFFTTGSKNGLLIGGIRNSEHRLWYVFNLASKMQWILTMIWGLIPVLIIIVGYWYFTKAFNIDIPFILFFATILLVVTLQDLPIAFAGFGSTTLAWSLFYSEYATPEAIASMTLCMPLLRLAVRGGIGAVSMKPALADVSMIISQVRQDKQR